MSTDVVIGSYLEPELVDKIMRADGTLRVHFRPDLLPVPQFRCDHRGQRRELSERQISEWRDLIEVADVFFDFDWLEPSLMPERCPKLKWVQATSAGIRTFMHDHGLDSAPFVTTTAAGVHADPLVEFALAGALYFMKDLPRLESARRMRQWRIEPTRTLAGTRALVVGLGAIGRAVAEQFSRLGVHVTGLGRDGRDYDMRGLDVVIERSALIDTLTSTDILILACPLTSETEGMIGALQLRAMPRGSIVINVARGGVIDESALIDALSDHHLGGACLDVFSEEPLASSSALWSVDNVILSPHSASIVERENELLVELFLDNFTRWRRGGELRNRFDPLVGY
jgi:phosphoglycerate dehydrogenase-like enzyme